MTQKLHAMTRKERHKMLMMSAMAPTKESFPR